MKPLPFRLFAILATLLAVAPALPETASREGGAPFLAGTARLGMGLAPLASTLHAQTPPVTLDSAFLAGYSWRNLGPERRGQEGEPSHRPVPAAIANVIFDATGVRMRRLPLRPERVLEELE